MSHDPSQQPPPAPDPSAPPPPPPPPGGYAPAPYAGAPAYGYGAAMPQVLQGRQLAGWGIRFGAALIDGIFSITLVGIVINWFLMGREGERNGMTLGKQLCNIRVIKEDGTPVTTGYAVLRELLVKTILIGWIGGFFLLIPTLLDYLWPLWDERNQALHDKMVSSYVVQG